MFLSTNNREKVIRIGKTIIIGRFVRLIHVVCTCLKVTDFGFQTSMFIYKSRVKSIIQDLGFTPMTKDGKMCVQGVHSTIQIHVGTQNINLQTKSLVQNYCNL